MNRNDAIGELWYNEHRPLERDIMSRDGRVVSRLFFGKEDDGAVISLDRAENWFKAQHEQKMLLLAHERPRADWTTSKKTGRVYEVVEADLFCARYQNRRRTHMLGGKADPEMQAAAGFDRFVCEILCGSCKLYFDLEFSRAANANMDGDALQTALLAACQAKLTSGAGFTADSAAWVPVQFTDVVVLDSSKASKFSKHVIVTLDGGNTAFADPRDVGRFVSDVLRDTGTQFFVAKSDTEKTVPFADLTVYSGRQPFRLYGAAKYNEPDRLLVQQNQRPGAWYAWDPDPALLRRSFATGLAAARTLQYGRTVAESAVTTTTTTRKRPVSQLNVRSTRPADVPQELIRELENVPIIGDARPNKYTYIPATATLFINCNCRDCPLAGREHTSNNIYIHVDLSRGRFRVRCHSPSCASAIAAPWTILPPACIVQANAFLASVWRPECVGNEATTFLLS